MKRNYYERCYIAFYWTLEHILLQSKEPIAPQPFSLCDLLSDMCPFTFVEDMSADPACFCEYERILKSKTGIQEDETVMNGYGAGCDFLQMYMTEYEYELEETIQRFSLEDFTSAYEKAKAEDAG